MSRFNCSLGLPTHGLLSQLLLLFTLSSVVNSGGILASYQAYNQFFTTFASRVGVRTLIYHVVILVLRRRDPHIFENIFNILALFILCVMWFGGAAWWYFSDADIWGYKTCRGCPGWERLRTYGGWPAALEAVVLGACMVLCVRNRMQKGTGPERSNVEENELLSK